MARITLYVPDDFKARMDAAGDGINWSEVARPALATALAAFEHSKGRNMTTAIERLRASKREGEQNAKLFGNKAGRAWAEDQARYHELRELHRRRENYPNEDPSGALKWVLDPTDEWVGTQEFAENNPGVTALASWASDEYREAFVEAAVNFYLEVREEVERD